MTARGHLRLRGRHWSLQVWSRSQPGERKRQRSFALGTITELPTKSKAWAAADRLLAALGARALDAGQAVRWSEWCRIYRERHLVLLAAGTRASRESMIRRHLEPAFRGRAVHELGQAEAQAFVVDQHRAGAAASTVRARFTLLRRMLRAASDAGLTASPPRGNKTDFPRSLSVPDGIRAKAFTLEEVARIVEAADPTLRTACYLARYAGLRCSEVLGVTWSAIDLLKGTLEVRQQALDAQIRPLKSKASAATLPMPSGLTAALVAYRQHWTPNQAGLLFAVGDGMPRDSATLRHELHQLLERLGIPRRGFHGFRHAFALSLAARGTNPEVIRRAMRHASLRETAIYLSATSEDIAQALRDSATGVETVATETQTGPEMPRESIETLIPEDISRTGADP